VSRLRVLRVLLLLPVVVSTVLAAQAPRPLPDHDSFVKATRDNLLRSQRDQFNYAYKERRTELRINPFGRMGTGDVEGFLVTPAENGKVILRRLIEKDGKPVTDGDVDRIEVKEERRREGRRTSMDDVVAMLTFTTERRETLNGRDAIVVRFTPRATATPETREGRIARVFAGSVWVDEAAREVMRVEATAVDSISFGFGLIARLNKGTTVTLTRDQIQGPLWLPTSIRFAGEGRALLVRKLHVDQRIEWFDYKKVLDLK
jgi:hypothetical protein